MSTNPQRSRMAYLLAASHSGSTLTAMLLNAHPQLCTVGELKIIELGNVEAYRCSCQRLILECPFWADVASSMKSRGFDFSIGRAGTDIRTGASAYVRKLLNPLHRGPLLEAARDLALSLSPTWRRQLPRIQAVNAALVASVLERRGKDVIVDSSKIGIRLKFLLRNPQLDMRIVRLVRDGRAVSLTYMDPERFADAKDPKLRGGGSGASRDAERLKIVEAAREWRRSNEEADALLARLPRSQWIMVRYEDLCRQPDAELRRVFAFLGVDADAPRPPFRAVENHVVGNGMRLDTSSEIQLDERWREVLGPEELATFDQVAGDVNRRLGYV